MSEEYTKNWIAILQEGKGLEAPEEERKQLNTAIATIATDGCERVWKPHVSQQLQKAARLMMTRARQHDREPLEFLKDVCDKWAGLDVYPESFLIAAKYALEGERC
jgi:hypothetical protein